MHAPFVRPQRLSRTNLWQKYFPKSNFLFQASEYTDQSSLRNIRDSEFEDSGRDSTTSSSKSRHSSRRCSEIGFSAHHEIDVPHYYPAYANVLKMKNSFFQPNTELVLYDCETGEGEMFITDENASQSAGIRLYSIKSEESCDGNILQNIHDQLHYAMATVHNLEKAEEAEEIRVKERNMKSLRLDHLKAKQILGKGGYAHVSLGHCHQLFHIFQFLEYPQLRPGINGLALDGPVWIKRFMGSRNSVRLVRNCSISC